MWLGLIKQGLVFLTVRAFDSAVYTPSVTEVLNPRAETQLWGRVFVQRFFSTRFVVIRFEVGRVCALQLECSRVVFAVTAVRMVRSLCNRFSEQNESR